MVPDALSPVAPARVRCLLVPTGRITRKRFLDLVKRLQNESIVRLSDVSPNSEPGNETFSPLAFPSGVVIYDLTIAGPTLGQRALYPFDISQEPLVILGVADAHEYESHSSESPASKAAEGYERDHQAELNIDLRQAIESLRATHNVALVHRVFVFDQNSDENLEVEGAISIATSSKTLGTALKTKMCDLTSSLLSQMGPYARSIQNLTTIETPRQAMPEGYVRPQTDVDHDSKRQSWFPGSGIRASSPNLALSRLANRASLPAHLFGSASTNPPSGPTTPSEEHPHSEATSPSTDSAATTFDQMQLRSPERRQTGLDGANNHMSVQSLGPDATGERGRSQGRGRISIVLGSMYLIAGRWADAVKELVQGGMAARSSNDHIWHAKAVDSILVALLLCAWAGIEFEVPPLCLPIAERSSLLLGKTSKKAESIGNQVFIHQPAAKEVKSENIKTLAGALPDIVQHVVRLYTRTTAEPVAQLVLSETFIRLSKLSAVLLYHPELREKEALETIVLNKKMSTPAQNDAILSLQTPAKAEIASLAIAAVPPVPIQHTMTHVDRLSIHAGIAGALGLIKYQRKKALILRELLVLLLSALETESADGSLQASLLFDQTESGSETNGSLGDGALASEPGTIYDLLVQICRIYGAVLVPAYDDLHPVQSSGILRPQFQPLQDEKLDEATLLAASLENEALTRHFGNRRLKLDILFACISVCEAVPDLRGAVSFSSSLLRTVSSGIAPGPQTVDGGPSLALDNQFRVTETLRQATVTAEELGLGKVEGEYWDDFLLREVEVLPTSDDLAVTKRKRSELAAVQQSLAKQADGPFIVNQFNQRTSISKREHFVVEGEKFCFSILLQNLYDVVLEIEALEMDAVGVEVQSKMEHFSIGAYQTQRLRIVAQANTSGSMTVRGCFVKIRNCRMRSYPIFKDSWRPKEVSRIKEHGLAIISQGEHRPASTASDITKAASSSRPIPATIQTTVVAPQPRMSIVSTSLIQNNMMVLEGERKRLAITVRNTSDQTIDFVALSFDDSALPLLRAAVQDRELPAAEIYELEYGIYRKAALSWPTASNDIQLKPGAELKFDVEVLGKPGLTSGAVHFDYAALKSGASDNEDIVYTRRASLSFSVTVTPGIDLIRNDILSLTGPLAHTQPPPLSQTSENPMPKADWTQGTVQPVREQLLLNKDEAKNCLLLLDFYNSWTSTLVVMPQIRRDGEGSDGWQNALQLSEPLDPGQSTRFLIPVPRMNLKDPYAPIPSLNPASKRQFVVSAGKVSEGYERSSRDAFWHREELLKMIRVVWLDPTTGRTGFVEMRSVRLNVRMLDALKLEGLDIDIAIKGSDSISLSGSDRYKLATDEFIAINTKLTNRSAQPIRPLLRLQPSMRNQPYNVALDLSKKFAFTGLLQQPLPLIKAGETLDVQLGAVFLCAGEYEISTSAEEIRVWRPPGDEGSSRQRSGSLVDLDVLSNERTDRRIWFAKDPCKLDVYDSEDR